jgi:NAD(P)-dependent dehydrogenase (short-subunit alcohol dehydrogenase family)
MRRGTEEATMSGLPDLAGKVAVVTGGASGIGKGIAARLAAEGARVIIADIQRDALEASAAELGVDGLPTDVSDSAHPSGLVPAGGGAARRDRGGIRRAAAVLRGDDPPCPPRAGPMKGDGIGPAAARLAR